MLKKELEKQDLDNLGEEKKNKISSKFSSKTKKGIFGILETQITKYKDPERYFRESLEKNEFRKLEGLVIDSNYRLSWERFAKTGVIDIENGIVEGIYWKWDLDLSLTDVKLLRKIRTIKGNLEGLQQVEDLGDLEQVGKDCKLKGTSIKTLGKLKEVGGSLICIGENKLEDLGMLEQTGKHCLLYFTNIKSLWNLRRVGGILGCDKIPALVEVGKLEKIGEILSVKGTPSEFQVKLIKKIKSGEIISKKNAFGGDIEGIENVLDQRKIPGNLLAINLPLKIQKNIIDMLNSGQLNIDGNIALGGNTKGLIHLLDTIPNDVELFLEGSHITVQLEALYKVTVKGEKINIINMEDGITKVFSILYRNNRLNFDGFQEIFGRNIKNIEDIESKEYAIRIMIREYEKVEQEIREKGNRIRGENEGKKLTEEEKIGLREKITEIGKELKKIREKIESFGVRLDDL